MIDRVKESLRWLGIKESETTPMVERVYAELEKIAKRTKRPVRATEIATILGRHRNRIVIHLGKLRDTNRAANIENGWIPLK